MHGVHDGRLVHGRQGLRRRTRRRRQQGVNIPLLVVTIVLQLYHRLSVARVVGKLSKPWFRFNVMRRSCSAFAEGYIGSDFRKAKLSMWQSTFFAACFAASCAIAAAYGAPAVSQHLHQVDFFGSIPRYC